ncbi:MAG TPA: DUF2341 domain-containing protein [Chitinispirillaceae bacterium]|nr:DUF2341 domain-containing protein [Chitinispirillaceae bacterium]
MIKNININFNCIWFLIISCFCTIMFCSSPTGGGSEAGNAKIFGKVVDSTGVPVGNAFVYARNTSFDPVKDVEVTTTGKTAFDGSYEICVEIGVDYVIEAKLPSQNTFALISDVAVRDSLSTAPLCTLKTPGSVKIEIPENIDREQGYVYIAGTSVFGLFKNAGEFVLLKDVPVVSMTDVLYSSQYKKDVSVIRDDITVHSGVATVIYKPWWRFSCRLLLNTTSSGADISSTIVHFPICVRLTKANFSFEDARPDGADVRFTKIDGTSLPCEIESWDATIGKAVIWVNIDTLYGNNASQSILMYWGNPTAGIGSYSTAVFDTTAGFQGVWHMNGYSTDTVYDATVNRYHGIPYGSTFDATVKGAIGSARYLNGTTNYISMPNTAAGKLDMPQNGTYTLSVWAYVDTLDTLWHTIAGKGHEQYYLRFKCLRNGKATWEFVEFQNQKGWEFTEDSIPSSPGSKQWVHLAGVRTGINQYLYVNGTMVDDSVHLMAGDYSRNTGDDFMIGRNARLGTIPYNEGWCYFKGMIDEVRVMNVAVSADWIKLSYMNQKAEDRLVEFRSNSIQDTVPDLK